MKFIRIFLWTLVFAMILQGYLHADEYGTAMSFIGGISLSMSIWKESIMTSVQALWSAPTYVILPRAFVIAAIRETIRHPGLHTLPSLRRGLAAHRVRWDAFRDMEVQWMLRHSDLIGAITTEGRYIWSIWEKERDAAISIIEANTRSHCTFLPSSQCAFRLQQIESAQSRLTNATRAADAWQRILHMDTSIGIVQWWGDIRASESIEEDVHVFHRSLQALHDIQWPSDARIRIMQKEQEKIVSVILDIWLRRLVSSLLERDIWAVCLEHIRNKESRIHSLMIIAGLQDMMNAHERALNASLRATENPQMVQEWFAEAYGYAWWMGDDIPAIVRRCSIHVVGDCARIGPTEIIALSAQYDERTRIIEDWSRRVFLGLWNALPALGLLFLLELIVLIVPQRRIYTYMDESNRIQLSRIQHDGRST